MFASKSLNKSLSIPSGYECIPLNDCILLSSFLSNAGLCAVSM